MNVVNMTTEVLRVGPLIALMVQFYLIVLVYSSLAFVDTIMCLFSSSFHNAFTRLKPFTVAFHWSPYPGGGGWLIVYGQVLPCLISGRAQRSLHLLSPWGYVLTSVYVSLALKIVYSHLTLESFEPGRILHCTKLIKLFKF